MMRVLQTVSKYRQSMIGIDAEKEKEVTKSINISLSVNTVLDIASNVALWMAVSVSG